MHFLYGLYSSRTPGEYRYIGVTKNPDQRLKSHVWGALSGSETNKHKARWISKEIAAGSEIQLKVLKQFSSEDDAYDDERWTITNLKRWGNALTNLSDGGKGEYFSDPVKLRSLSEKAMTAKDSEEYREQARIRALAYYSKEENREAASEFARRGWETRDRTAWNKGHRTAAPKPPKMVVGSEEYRRHASTTTTEFFKELKSDPEKYAEYRESRLEVGKIVSVSKKKEWSNLTPEARKARGHKMSLGKRYNRAKRNGWDLTLTPVEHTCKDRNEDSPKV